MFNLLMQSTRVMVTLFMQDSRSSMPESGSNALVLNPSLSGRGRKVNDCSSVPTTMENTRPKREGVLCTLKVIYSTVQQLQGEVPYEIFFALNLYWCKLVIYTLPYTVQTSKHCQITVERVAVHAYNNARMWYA